MLQVPLCLDALFEHFGQINQVQDVSQTSRMLEPFVEVGGDVPEYFTSRTHFTKIEDKKVIAKN